MFKIKDVKENVFYTNIDKKSNYICLYSYNINKIIDNTFYIKINTFIILLPSYTIKESYHERLINTEDLVFLKEAPEEYIRAYNYCKENYVFK